MHYLDHATQSWPKPPAVYHALDGDYDLFEMRAKGCKTGVIESVQMALSELLNIPDLGRIHFTQGQGDALKLALELFPWQPGDGIVMSAVEHQAMLAPVLHLARTRGVQFYVVPYALDLPFSLAECEALLKAHPNIRLIATTHASNVIGCVLPIAEIANLAKRYGKLYLLDASQTAGLLPLDVQRERVDILALSGCYALNGPRSIGALYWGEQALSTFAADAGFSSSFVPEAKCEVPLATMAEGLPLSHVAAWAGGIHWVQSTGLSAIHRRTTSLLEALQDGLGEIPEVTLYGCSETPYQLPLLSFNVLNHHPEVLANRLFEEYGILLRAGFHESRLSHEAIGTIHRGGTLRASLGYSSRLEDVDALIKALKYIVLDSSAGAWGFASKRQ